jgi:hypothetical protein
MTFEGFPPVCRAYAGGPPTKLCQEGTKGCIGALFNPPGDYR